MYDRELPDCNFYAHRYTPHSHAFKKADLDSRFKQA